MFIGYPKETKGSFFDSCQENKVIVLANTKFLEQLYDKLQTQRQCSSRRING